MLHSSDHLMHKATAACNPIFVVERVHLREMLQDHNHSLRSRSISTHGQTQ